VHFVGRGNCPKDMSFLDAVLFLTGETQSSLFVLIKAAMPESARMDVPLDRPYNEKIQSFGRCC